MEMEDEGRNFMPTEDPDLKIAPYFSLWVYGREFPSSGDRWDGSWLDVEARVEAQGATVEVRGSFLRDSDIGEFCKELEQLTATLSGKAHLKCLEPNLDVTLLGDTLGHITAKILISPDHLTQSHEFIFALDQTHLNPLIAACKKILARYPIREPDGQRE
jgi:hypothetical protein